MIDCFKSFGYIVLVYVHLRIHSFSQILFTSLTLCLLNIAPNHILSQDVYLSIDEKWAEIKELQSASKDVRAFQKLVELEEFLYEEKLEGKELTNLFGSILAFPLDTEELEPRLSSRPTLLAKLYEYSGIKSYSSNPTLAEEYFKKGILTLNDESVSHRLFRWMGLVLGFQERLEESLEYFNLAIEVAKDYYPPGSYNGKRFLCGSYFMAVPGFLNIGDLKTGRKYLNAGLSLAKEINDDYYVAAGITMKSQELERSNRHEETIRFIRENEHRIISLDKNNKGLIYHALGDALFNTGQFRDAISAIQLSHSFNTIVSNKIISQQTIGEGHYALKEFDAAIKNYNEIIEFYEKNDGNEGLLAEALFLRAQSYKELKKLQQAKNDIKRALSLKGAFDNYKVNHRPLLTNIYLDYFDQSQKTIYLDSAFILINQTDSIINQVRLSRRYFEDELSLGEEFYDAHASILLSYSRLKNIDHSLLNQERIFNYVENLKAASLKVQLRTDNAVNIGNIPEQFLQKERVYKTKISDLEQRVYESESELFDSTYQQIQLELDSIKDIYYKYLKDLEEKYPGYYRHQYGNESVSLSEVQSHLQPDERLIEYFISEDRIFQLIISGESFDFKFREVPKTWDKQVLIFRKYLADSSTPVDSFEKVSQYFYNYVIKDAIESLPDNVKRLRIVPDDVLNFIPFELLIDTTSSSKDYRHLDYLQNKYVLSYTPSASLLVKGFITDNTKHKKNYIGFAPSYSGVDSILGEDNQRNTNEDLPYARESVANALELFGGKIFTGDEATITRFVEHANHASIIQLAMHGVIDLENPSFSNLVFYGDEDDNRLYTNEVFGMELNSNLAVLSACNTGIGKIINGDGIQNMSRAFSFAGVRNTIMSLWSVPDIQTGRNIPVTRPSILLGRTCG